MYDRKAINDNCEGDESMKGVKVVGPKQVEVVDWEEQVVQPHEVKVRIKAAALCRSDLSIYYQLPVVGSLPAGSVIPGHEPAGVIEEIGSAVKGFAVGDRVAIQCFDGCGLCQYCLDGWPNMCANMKVLGFDRHGGDAETLVTPASTCLKMPDEMSFLTASIATDAIGNLYNTLKELNVNGNKRVAIIGIGPMGLAGVLAAKAMGAEVIAVDMVQSRLDTALALGADHAFLSPDAEKAVNSITKGKGCEAVVDCTGKEPAIRLAFNLAGKFAKIGQLGVGDEAKIGLMSHLVGKQLTYIGSWYFRMGEWNEICDLIVHRIGNEKAEKLISHVYPLETKAVIEGWKLFDEHKTDKVVFVP
jgi:threonine dehydrogenase-like Zn-dependent dehydrogenase